MSRYKKILSYFNVINEKRYDSIYNGVLEINWLNGKKILDTKNTNYSYGNLGKVLNKALKYTKTDFLKKDAEILILGLGGGDVVKQLRENFKSQARITAVEIDPVIIEVALNEFNIVPDSYLELIRDDAENFLKYTKERFDVIIVDLFYDMEIPDFVFQKSFIQIINNRLNIHGSVIFNTFVLNNDQEIRNNQFLIRLDSIFQVQSFKKLYGHNHLIIALK